MTGLFGLLSISSTGQNHIDSDSRHLLRDKTANLLGQRKIIAPPNFTT